MLWVGLPFERFLHPFLSHIAQIHPKTNLGGNVEPARFAWVQRVCSPEKFIRFGKLLLGERAPCRERVRSTVIGLNFKRLLKSFIALRIPTFRMVSSGKLVVTPYFARLQCDAKPTKLNSRVEQGLLTSKSFLLDIRASQSNIRQSSNKDA